LGFLFCSRLTHCWQLCSRRYVALVLNRYAHSQRH
jgi:hypothetical protein